MKTYQAIWELIKSNKTLSNPVSNRTIEAIALMVAQDNEPTFDEFRERNEALFSSIEKRPKTPMLLYPPVLGPDGLADGVISRPKETEWDIVMKPREPMGFPEPGGA